MSRAVAFSPEARADIEALYLFIAGRSGEDRALGYLERIEGFCLAFGDFPERGRRRDEVRPGLRTASFERRVMIAYAVGEDAVTVLRVLYGGRDVTASLGEEAG